MKNHQRLSDMLAAISAIESFAVSDYDQFMADMKAQDAIMFNLIIMGEAANQVSRDFREQHSSIPWSSIVGTRNVIVHGYDQVRLQIVWEIIQHDLGPLRTKLEKLLER